MNWTGVARGALVIESLMATFGFLEPILIGSTAAVPILLLFGVIVS
jgi:hypothetical protein